MYQIAVDKAYDNLCGLRLGLEGLTEPDFNEAAVTEATGNGKDHCHDGDNGQQGAIGQGCRLLQHALGGKEADGQHYLLQHFQPQEPERRDIALGDAPEVLLEKIYNLLIIHI